MLIPCKKIGRAIEQTLQNEVAELTHKGKRPSIVTILAGNASEQLSFVAIKQKVAERLGIGFEGPHFEQIPDFEWFQNFLREKSADPTVTGIIVQQPLPQGYDAEKMFENIPYKKEIEGHKPNSTFQFPLSLSVLTGIKYVYNGQKIDENSVVNFQQDISFFQKVLKDKNIVIAGRGPTGGGPISKCFATMNIPVKLTHSQTPNPTEIYKQADIIITATGRKIISPDVIKPGVVLLNVGLRHDGERLRGDFDEDEVKDIASFYNKTPGGLGPIDVLYLYKNLVDGTKQQV